MKESQSLRKEQSTTPWPPQDLERVTECPVCSSPQRTLLHDNLADRVFFSAPGTWALYKCSDCGSAYLDPRPTPASIGRAYAEYYTHVGSDPAPASELPKVKRFRRALANGYRNWRYGTTLEPASTLGVPFAYALPSARHSIDATFRYLPKAVQGAALLDIGAGNGDFLSLARSAGWTVQEGVEPDTKAVATCRDRGLNVHLGGLEQLAGERACFDFITISHVIEHVYDPKSMIQRAFELLKTGGHLYVDTPNIDAFGHKRYGAFWRGLEPPRHLILFNWGSLERVLRDVGFTHITRRPCATVYADLSAKSRALALDRDDCINARSVIGDRLMARLLAARMSFTGCDHSEFVTVLASKGE